MNARQLGILNYLLEQKDYVTAKVLAQKFNVTPKTIYIDVNVLRSELAPFHLDIDKKPYRGILLLGDDKNKLEAKNSVNSLKRVETENIFDIDVRRQNLFIELVLNGRSISLQDMAEEYFVSKSAILNDLEFLSKKYLSKFHVFFETINKRIQLVGTEKNIQAAIIDCLLNTLIKDTKLELKSYFNFDTYDTVLELFRNKKIINNIHMADYYKQALLVTLLVISCRLENGYHMNKDDFYSLDDMDFISGYPIANEVARYLEGKLNIIFHEEDKTILAKYLALYRTEDIEVDKSKYKKIIDEIIIRLEQVENIEIMNRSELEEQLYQHIPPMIMRLRNGVNIINPLLDEIKTRYLHLFTVSWYVLSIIENTYNLTLTEDEVSFITIYFQMAIHKSSHSHNVLVVCPYGIVSSKYIVNQLRLALPRYDDIQSCSLSDLKYRQLDEFDLIISTSPQHIDTLVPVVRVSPLLDNTDYAKIFDSYAKNVFLQTPRLNETLQNNHIFVPTLKKYINEEYLFFKASFRSKEECLNYIIQKFEHNQVVKKEFKESVYQREEIGCTVLENGVSLPHGKPSAVNKIAVAIMTLSKPIKWSSYWVDMVILLAIPEDKSDEFNKLVLEIYSMVSNVNVISEIKKIEQKEQYIHSLQ